MKLKVGQAMQIRFHVVGAKEPLTLLELIEMMPALKKVGHIVGIKDILPPEETS